MSKIAPDRVCYQDQLLPSVNVLGALSELASNLVSHWSGVANSGGCCNHPSQSSASGPPLANSDRQGNACYNLLPSSSGRGSKL